VERFDADEAEAYSSLDAREFRALISSCRTKSLDGWTALPGRSGAAICERTRRVVMINNVNTHRPINHTLAVIDGGLNFKTEAPTPPTAPNPKLLDQVRQAIRTRQYSDRTEKAYVHWIKRFIFFHNKRHPAEMGEAEIGRFLSALATDLNVSASTQNQALNALLFLYREILRKKIGYVNGVIRAKRPHRLPVVLTRQEIRSILGCLDESEWLMAMLLYGAGLRLMECSRLRSKISISPVIK
jgi:Phage integrase, N-terminal SAM-like domain